MLSNWVNAFVPYNVCYYTFGRKTPQTCYPHQYRSPQHLGNDYSYQPASHYVNNQRYSPRIHHTQHLIAILVWRSYPHQMLSKEQLLPLHHTQAGGTQQLLLSHSSHCYIWYPIGCCSRPLQVPLLLQPLLLDECQVFQINLSISI